MKYILMLSIFAACAGGPTQLSQKAKDLEVVTHKPVNCATVGKVVGNDKTGSKDVALNDALNQASSLGATSLHVNQEVPNGRNMAVYATAYKCD
ncbi:MAG TPA: hypothetical protein VNJ08_13940 [Bacteriovoracaceae bacterium]|nr:hypothetical protein [Bacteriovoracaceae bacterium]